MARSALPAFGLQGAGLEFVAAVENVVFKVLATNGSRYALRLHRPGYHNLAALESELEWTSALASAGVAVATALRTQDGSGYVRVASSDGHDVRFAGAVEWIDGKSLRTLVPRSSSPRDDPALAARYREVGAVAAQIHNQATGWPLPDGFRRHAFDAQGFVGESPFWGRFWDAPELSEGERKTLSVARRRIGEALTSGRFEAGCYSLIHADLHPGNLLATDKDLWVLDFDDAGFGWHHYELAVAVYGYEGTAHYEPALQALVDGYRSHRALSDRALEELPLFTLIRTLAHIGRINTRPELRMAECGRVLVARACECIASGRVV